MPYGQDLVIEVCEIRGMPASSSDGRMTESRDSTEGSGLPSAGKPPELTELQQDGPLPSTEAEATLPTSQVATDVATRNAERLSPGWELVAILCVCAVAGVIGTHIRIELEEAFNYEGLKLMERWDCLFQDLPANMVGCFFMGIVGVACKAHIAQFSELIALGLATGLMGSITTYASWNQDMAQLFVAGYAAKALFGIMLGLQLPFVSLLVGIHAGQGILWVCSYCLHQCEKPIRKSPDNLRRQKAVAWIAAFLWLGILLPVNVVIAAFKWGDTGRHVQAIAACISPLGVWLRWYLSRFNGGFLKGSLFGWIPWGTLAANALASMLLTLDRMADVQITSHVWSVWLEAIGKGVMGCLSTVSTFMVEVLKLSEGKSPWKAYCYISISLLGTQLIAFILYGIPVWVEHFPRAFPDGVQS